MDPCVGVSYYLNNAPFKLQEKYCPISLIQIFVGLWCRHFLLSQDSSVPSVRQTTPHFKTNVPVVTSTLVLCHAPLCTKRKIVPSQLIRTLKSSKTKLHPQVTATVSHTIHLSILFVMKTNVGENTFNHARLFYFIISRDKFCTDPVWKPVLHIQKAKRTKQFISCLSIYSRPSLTKPVNIRPDLCCDKKTPSC